MAGLMRSIVACLLLLGACSASVADPGPNGLAPIKITASPVALDASDPARDRVGRLRYLGGIALDSDDVRFGGLSGLRLIGPGRMLAVTDGGHWVAMNLIERGDRLAGIDSAAIGVIRGPKREPLRGKAFADAEALEAGPRGYTVAFEREHRIWHYRTFDAAAGSEEFPDARWLASLPPNDGIEAIAKVGDEWLYIAEATLPNGRHEGILLSHGQLARTYGRVAVDVPAAFRPTDAHALDANRVMILARRFSPLSGVAAALVVTSVDREKLALGPSQTIAELAPPLTVDNMEGLAVGRSGGRTFVYLASDDNFSPLQRTLIMKFELLP